jgi:hypothetical protein
MNYIIEPEDIGTYVYCPKLQRKGLHEKLFPKLSTFEQSVRDAIVLGEERALLKDSIVDVNKLTRAWDKTWWPAAVSNSIKMSEADKLTLKATEKFIDYCDYEFSDYSCPTIGVDIESQLQIGRSILKCKADLIKMNLNDKNKNNTMIINMSKRSLSIREAAFDPAIRATVYGFYRGGETITHVNLNIDEKNNKFSTSISSFRPEDMETIRKMIEQVQHGIESSTVYMNPYLCKECNVCPELKF